MDRYNNTCHQYTHQLASKMVIIKIKKGTGTVPGSFLLNFRLLKSNLLYLTLKSLFFFGGF